MRQVRSTLRILMTLSRPLTVSHRLRRPVRRGRAESPRAAALIQGRGLLGLLACYTSPHSSHFLTHRPTHYPMESLSIPFHFPFPCCRLPLLFLTNLLTDCPSGPPRPSLHRATQDLGILRGRGFLRLRRLSQGDLRIFDAPSSLDARDPGSFDCGRSCTCTSNLPKLEPRRVGRGGRR